MACGRVIPTRHPPVHGIKQPTKHRTTNAALKRPQLQILSCSSSSSTSTKSISVNPFCPDSSSVLNQVDPCSTAESDNHFKQQYSSSSANAPSTNSISLSSSPHVAPPATHAGVASNQERNVVVKSAAHQAHPMKRQNHEKPTHVYNRCTSPTPFTLNTNQKMSLNSSSLQYTHRNNEITFKHDNINYQQVSKVFQQNSVHNFDDISEVEAEERQKLNEKYNKSTSFTHASSQLQPRPCYAELDPQTSRDQRARNTSNTSSQQVDGSAAYSGQSAPKNCQIIYEAVSQSQLSRMHHHTSNVPNVPVNWAPSSLDNSPLSHYDSTGNTSQKFTFKSFSSQPQS